MKLIRSIAYFLADIGYLSWNSEKLKISLWRTTRTKKVLLKVFALLLIVAGLYNPVTSHDVTASVTVTVATNGTNISADTAANAISPSYTTLGDIIIDENSNSDFSSSQSNRTLILTPPTNWEFLNSGVTVSRQWWWAWANGFDITSISVQSISSTSLTIRITTDSNANRDDRVVISNLKVRPISGNIVPSSWMIFRTCANPGNLIVNGITCDSTDFWSLSMKAGSLSSLFVTLVWQTFSNGTWNTWSVTAQTAWINFIIAGIRAVDQFKNIVTSYNWVKTISYTGPTWTPTYTTGVSFTSWVSTTTLNTLLRKAETTTITVADGSITWQASSSLIVNTWSLSRLLLILSGETYAPGTISGKTGTPSQQVASIWFTGTVYGVDSWWNIVSTTHTIHITSSDINAILPSNFSLVWWLKQFFTIISTVGSFSMTATDVTNGSILSWSSNPVATTWYTDLAISNINESDGSVYTWELVSFQIFYNNLWPRTKTGAYLEVDLGTGFIYQSSSPALFLSWSKYYFTWINLTSGLSGNLILTAAVASWVLENTNIVLTGTIYPTLWDNNSSNNVHTSVVHVDQHPVINLSVFKSADVSTALPWDIITYTINYLNHTWFDTATGTILTDTLSWLTYLTSSIAPTSQSWNQLIFALWNLTGWYQNSFVLTASINNNILSGTIVSNSVSITGQEYDDDLWENTDIANVIVYWPVADLAITKMASLTWAEVNDTVVFTINYVNNWPQTASWVVIEDVFGTWMTFVSSSPAMVLSWGKYYHTGFNLASWQTGTIIITGLVTAWWSQITGYNNIVSISSSTFDTNNTNNSAIASFSHLFGFDLFVNKSINTGNLVQWDTVIYTINYGNLHDFASWTVTVVDTLPSQIDFISASTGTYNSGTHTLTFYTENLSAWDSWSIIITWVANNSIIWWVSYNNTVQISGIWTDGTWANNTDNAAFTGNQYADLVAQQSSSVSWTLYSWQIIVYTLTYENDGPSDVYANLDNYFSPAVTFVSASTGTYNSWTHELEVPSFFLAAGSTWVTVTITWIGNNNITSWLIIVNTWTFETSISDPNLSNNTVTTTNIWWVENIPPTASINYSPSIATSGTVIATLTWASETITITNNGGSTNYIFTGNWSFTFTFQDLAGNTWSALATVTWIDNIAPTAAINYSPWTTTSGNVIATLTWASESITITNNGWSGNYTFTANGTFVFEFEDTVWNTWSTTAIVTWIDTTAPTATVAYNPVTATSGNVIATLTWASESITITNNGWSANYTFTGNGSFIFTFVDVVGNTGSTTATVTWIDTVAPSIPVLVSPINSAYVGSNVTLLWTGSTDVDSGISGYSYIVASWSSMVTVIAQATVSTDNATLSLSDWTYYWWVKAIDNASNESQYSQTWIFIVDTTIPSATFSYSPSTGTSSDVVVTILPSEPVTITNNSGSESYTFTGNGSFTFEFIDSGSIAGSGTATVTWIDKTAPSIPVPLQPINSETGGSTRTLVWSWSIDTWLWLSGYYYQVSLDNSFSWTVEEWEVSTTWITISWLANNTYYWRVLAYDVVMNQSLYSTVSDFIVDVDTTAPTATIEYDPIWSTTGNVLVLLTGFSEPVTWINATGYTFSANWSFTFTFQDLVGNTWSIIATVTWIQDPVVETVQPSPSWWWWSRWRPVQLDSCPDGDTSWSRYDWSCWEQTKDTESTGTMTNNSGTVVDSETTRDGEEMSCNRQRPSFDCVLLRWRSIGLTKAKDRNEYRASTLILRKEAAAMLDIYSSVYNKWNTIVTEYCRFDDIDKESLATIKHILSSCKKDIFAWSQEWESFLPNNILTQAQSATVLVKMVRWVQSPSQPWYAAYYIIYNSFVRNDYAIKNAGTGVYRWDFLRTLYEMTYWY